MIGGGHVIGGIDHAVIAVADLDSAVAAYRRLGFKLSPRIAAPDGASHTILLAHDYVELLAPAPEPQGGSSRWRDALQRGEGLAGFAVRTADARAVRAAWQAEGLAPSAVRCASRDAVRADGPRATARFEVVSLPADTVPDVSIFACAHLTREAVWIPELMQHPNTACAIRGIVVAVRDPRAAAPLWMRVLPGSHARSMDGGIRIGVMSHRIDLIDREMAKSRYGLKTPFDRARAVAIEFAARNVDACRATLPAEKVTALTGGGIGISAADACGVALAFVGDDVPET